MKANSRLLQSRLSGYRSQQNDIIGRSKKYFTEPLIEKIFKILNPPPNFDLIGHLRRAVYIYFLIDDLKDWLSIDYGPPEKKNPFLDKFSEKTDKYLAFLKSIDGKINILGTDELENLQLILRAMSFEAQVQNNEIIKRKKGRPTDSPCQGYCWELYSIFLSSTGYPPTSRTNPYGDEKPYGPAFEFFTSAFELVHLKLGVHAVQKYLKDAIKIRKKFEIDGIYPNFFSLPLIYDMDSSYKNDYVLLMTPQGWIKTKL
jgi:hypothetical protein